MRRLYVIYTSLMHVVAKVMIIERGDMRGVSDVRGSGIQSAILVRRECLMQPGNQL